MPEPDGPQFADPDDRDGGDCYRAAYLNASRLRRAGKQNVTVVHGIPTGGPGMDISTMEGGVRIGHAWNEYDETFPFPDDMPDQVLRMVSDQSHEEELVFPAGGYYNIGRIDPEENQAYTEAQAEQALLRYHHYGPWTAHADLLDAT
tara:strand:- start:2743 stop:3183 length:441 start_codon:yes stop_codon:yes gene_type:complete